MSDWVAGRVRTTSGKDYLGFDDDGGWVLKLYIYVTSADAMDRVAGWVAMAGVPSLCGIVSSSNTHYR